MRGFVITTFSFLLLSVNILNAQQTQSIGAKTLQIEYKGKTRPLSELSNMSAMSSDKRSLKKSNKMRRIPPNFINHHNTAINPDQIGTMDPVRQSVIINSGRSGSEPLHVIEGIDENFTDIGVPDTNGDAGPEHYIQIVNATWFQIFAKDGTALTGPIAGNTIWSQINKQSFSDPIIMYDEDAQRWLITDLADINELLFGVSETSDPMGSWFLYSYRTDDFADYPKYGVWKDSYILTSNAAIQNSYPVHAINRSQLLQGLQNVDVQLIYLSDISGGFPAATPMDWNGSLPPPGNKAFVMRINDNAWGNGNTTDQLEVWEIDVDWNNAANTKATLQVIPTAAFNSNGCPMPGGGSPGEECIPQPGTLFGIDGIMTVIMHNIAYWNYGSYQSAVLCFSVKSDSNTSGIRWAELRREGEGAWTLYQESTFAPDDGASRFIPAISINGKGDIALAYSISGPENYPSLRYTGRRNADPLGQMTLDEYEFASGSGVRGFFQERYGDYARMSVDPIDGTFWFTSEYVKEDGSYGTSIVHYSISQDTLDIGPVALISPVNAPDLGDSEIIAAEFKNLGLESVSNFAVGYLLDGTILVQEDALQDILHPGETYSHIFSGTADLSEIRDYEFKVFSSFADDQNTRNDTLRKIVRKLPRFDATISDIRIATQVVCGERTEVFITLKNEGTEELSSVYIEYSLNDGPTENIFWTGSLASKSTEEVSVQISALLQGENVFKAYTMEPNGVPDQFPGNDSRTQNIRAVLDGQMIHFKLQLDDYPYETSWFLMDEDENVLYTEGPYFQANEYEIINRVWCLESEKCFNFLLLDSYGDGLFEPGNYEITDASGNKLASMINPDFGFAELNEFCTGKDCNVAFEINVSPASGPVEPNGTILITVISGVAPFTYSINAGQSAQNEPLFNSIPPGTYQIVVTDANGCTLTQEGIVDFTVSTDELQNSVNQVKVFPNPSENGIFILELSGIQATDPVLDFEIIDHQGKRVSFQSIPKVDGKYAGIVSLVRFPSGIYFVRFKDSKLRNMIKLIKS